MKEIFKSIWNLRQKKERIKELIKDNSKKLDEIKQDLEKKEIEAIKEKSSEYYIPLTELFKENNLLAERFIKMNKIVHKLKIDNKNYKWQKSKLEGYAVSIRGGLALFAEPPENKEYKKILFIQIEE